MNVGPDVHRSLQPSLIEANQCAPENAEAEAQQRTGSLDIEKRWIRSRMDEVYLWRRDVPDVDAGAPEYSGPDVPRALNAYFNALRSQAFTASGKRRDAYSYMTTVRALVASTYGQEQPGFGIEWAMASSRPPRGIRVAYVQPGSEAARLGIQRGDALVSADGIPADASAEDDANALAASLFPRRIGTRHAWVLRSGTGPDRAVALASGFTRTPVPIRRVLPAADGRSVGYLLFVDHSVPAAAALSEAMKDFREKGVTDLVIDLRYNGGGLTVIASQLAYMVAGDARTAGKAFVRLQDNQPGSSESDPFERQRCIVGMEDCASDERLPTLQLERVFILTQQGTCSASEMLINGLRGIDVAVVQIGGVTCGKPYGFTPQVNCGHAYLPTRVAVSNELGFGGYGDGFTPGGSGGAGVPGCAVADDLEHPLGDVSEGQLAAALHYRAEGRCPLPVVSAATTDAAAPGAARGTKAAVLQPWRDPLRENAHLIPRR
ncbi:hypothetical protein ABE85_21395 [Mitsuaria sp. 7]|nr:hypothetical protein ABE85_21395 [Mitsuaria sp. 7]